MAIAGTLCLIVAALLWLVPLQLIVRETGKRNDGGMVWGAIFVLLPMWLLLAVALCTVAARGGFDWISPRYPLLLVSALAMLVVSFFSLLGKTEPASQMPVSTRAFTGWAVQVFPLVVIAFCLLALEPLVPALLVRLPLVATASLSLLAGAGLLIEWIVSVQRRQQARIEEAVAFDDKRNRDVLARVESLRTVEDFAELLGFANRFEEAPIRTLAITKAQAHPDFTAALATALAENAWGSALVYLDACEPPDRRAVAEPVRAAILHLATNARDSIARTHTLFADQFDWDTRIILSVADKFAHEGVDYLHAVREFRAALDEPHPRPIRFNAQARLDEWLARREKAQARGAA